MKSALLDLLKRQSFQPFFWSILINPFFFIRRGLCHGIRKNQKYLTGHMLDFGCGRKPYKNLFSVDRYTGVDIEVSGHSHELSEVDVYYDGKVLPFPDNTFDSFFCSEVVEHIFNLDSILAEIKRVLKPGAKGLLTVPFAWPEHEVPYDFGRYTSFALPLILKKHGF
ncbi:MAG TPA: class I SAM-dependent methyltransferase, partial [Bacteroidia bacterium]|nr:class I SAM-dependent methyltransferase [Bacteroidia bacterium]